MKYFFKTALLLLSLSCLSFRTPQTIITEGDALSSNQPWSKIFSNPQLNVKLLFIILNRSIAGKRLISKTSDYDLIKLVSAGSTSSTVATLSNHHQSKKISFEITIDRDLPPMDAVLDLAHELTHLIFKIPIPNTDSVDTDNSDNSEDNFFSLKTFLSTVIEGPGGEVDAYLTECRVLRELSPHQFNLRPFCNKVTGFKDRNAIVEDFYKLGDYYQLFVDSIERLGEEIEDFPLISNKTPNFIAAISDLPYPLSALKEYLTILQRYCKKKSDSFSSSSYPSLCAKLNKI